MTFGKYRLVKVKPFGKTSGNLSLQTPRNPEEEEKKGKMRPTRGGKPHTTSCLKKKKKSHTVETASLAATNAPANPSRSLSGFSDPASFFSSCPSRSTTSRNRILASRGRGPRGSRAPRRPQPRRYSPEPLGASDGSGRGLAASRDPRGLAGSGPRGRKHVAGTSLP